jgi:glycerol-3-phosphate acyltransferase PlsY
VTVVAAAVAAYLLGGVPIGLLVGRTRGIVDIRKYGSGNIGATNVLRVIGVKAGLTVWALDCFKGALPVLLARHDLGISEWSLGLVALAAVGGHCFSPYLKLTGGKGVATGLGAMLGLYWLPSLCALVLFILIVWRTRYISLGSIVGALSVPVFMALLHAPPGDVAGSVAIALVVTVQHRGNIQRLRTGTERKFGQKASPEPAPAADGNE